MSFPAQQLSGKIELNTEFGAFLGDTRIRLLEAIDEHGSITRAAKVVPLSYKAAWDAVDAMNNLAEQPLVNRAAGGRAGGGTTLTDYGRRIVALYRALEVEYQGALARLAQSMAEGRASDFAQFQRALRRLSMRTSARNQFAGLVSGLRLGEVDVEVCLRLDAGDELVAVITRESAENLGLTLGMEITALVKSSSVMLLTETGVRVSARNRLWGTVTRIHDGPVNAEVVLELPGGKSICAVVTHDSATRLSLRPGASACAVFQASAVILCL